MSAFEMTLPSVRLKTNVGPIKKLCSRKAFMDVFPLRIADAIVVSREACALSASFLARTVSRVPVDECGQCQRIAFRHVPPGMQHPTRNDDEVERQSLGLDRDRVLLRLGNPGFIRYPRSAMGINENACLGPVLMQDIDGRPGGLAPRPAQACVHPHSVEGGAGLSAIGGEPFVQRDLPLSQRLV